MFGYVRPAKNRLSPADQRRYESVYCGLCHQLRADYGYLWTGALNYDLTFLSLLHLALKDEEKCHLKRCVWNPAKKKQIISETQALSYAADLTVLFTEGWRQDAKKDEKGPIRVLASAGGVLTKHGYAHAVQARPREARVFFDQQARLIQLEKDQCASLDETADCFGTMLACMTGEAEGVIRRILSQLLYHLGRWVYLIDACADLSEDLTRQRYNPLALRFPALDVREEKLKVYLERMLGQSLAAAQRACSLLPLQSHQSLLNHILQDCLPMTTQKILAGYSQK